jgi:hypothetical protein
MNQITLQLLSHTRAMADETFDQWRFIKETGLKIEFIKPRSKLILILEVQKIY